MRRDMDLIRTILLKLEEMPMEAGAVYSIDYSDEFFEIERYTFDEVIYHLQLILQAGLTEPPDNQGMSSFTYSGLSWSGHDFLDSVRDPKVWGETKAAAKKVGGWSIEILGAIAKAIVKDQLKKIGLDIG